MKEMSPRSNSFAAVISACLFASSVAEAQTVTWDAGTNSTWDTSTANWTGGTYANGNEAHFLGSGSGTVTLTGSIAPSKVLVASSNDYTFTGSGLENAGWLDKTGSGTLELTATGNTATGINAAGGNLILSGSSTTTTTDVNVANSGITGGGSGILTVKDTATLRVTGNFLLGNRTGRDGTVNQTGGTVNLSSSDTNAVRVGHWSNLTGTYTISDGSLNVLNTNFLAGWDGTGILNVNGGVANLKGLGLGVGNSPARAGTLNLSGGTLNVGTGGIYQKSNATVNLNSGKLGALADWSSALDMNVNGEVRVDTSGGNITLNGNLIGDGTLNKTNSGTLKLTGGSNALANINAAGGELVLSGDSNTTVSADMYVSRSDVSGGGVGALTVEENAVLNVDGRFAMGRQNSTDASVTQTGGIVNLNGTTTFGEWSVLTASYTISDGALNVQNQNLTLGWDGKGVLNVNGGTVNVKGLNLGYGNHGARSGTVNLNGGRLNVGAGGITREVNSAINLNKGTLGAQADWSTNMNVTLGDSVDDSVDVDTSGGNITLSGDISGLGALKKVGDGTLLLQGTNTYTGTTNITGGTVTLQGSHVGGGNYSVSGGTLAGGGSTDASITVGAGGVLKPGNSPGTLSTGAQIWQDAGSYHWEINDSAGAAGSDPGWDLLSINGTLDLTLLSEGGFTINLFSLTETNEAGDASGFDAWVASDGLVDYSFVIGSASGGILGFEANDFVIDSSGFENDSTGWNWQLSQDNNDLVLKAYAVPEPSSCALLGLGALALAVRRNKG